MFDKDTQTQVENIDIDNLTIEAFKEFVGETVFTIDFIKKTTGEERSMNARIGVSKGVKGTRPEATAKRNETLKAQNMVTVYEMTTGEFRTIWLDTVTSLKAKGRTLITSKFDLLSPERKAEILLS